jgi:transposase
MLPWEEHRQRGPDGYRYSLWCELYRSWEGRLSPTMRQAHPAGERMLVDYAGQTVAKIDAGTGECGRRRCSSPLRAPSTTPTSRRL